MFAFPLMLIFLLMGWLWISILYGGINLRYVDIHYTYIYSGYISIVKYIFIVILILNLLISHRIISWKVEEFITNSSMPIP